MSRPQQLVAVAIVMLVVLGCATVDRRVPAYPARGQSMEQIQADQAHCRTWAEQNAADPGKSALGGAAIGAVVVGGVGAVFGAVLYALVGLNPAEGAGIGAALGGIVGATEGAGGSAAAASEMQERAYNACMTTRGYTVR